MRDRDRSLFSRRRAFTEGRRCAASPRPCFDLHVTDCRVTDETSAAGSGDTSLTYLIDGRVIGGDVIIAAAVELGFAPAPGPVQVACRHNSTDASDEPVTLKVVDPDGNNRRPQSLPLLAHEGYELPSEQQADVGLLQQLLGSQHR